MIVCDGCHKPMRWKKEVHEYFDYEAGIPQLCGYGISVRKRDWERWQREKIKKRRADRISREYHDHSNDRWPGRNLGD